MIDQTVKCFSPQPQSPFPQIIGGNIDNTEFSCIQYNSQTKRILATGASSSTDIVTSISTPIITYLDENTGRLIWQKQYTYNPGLSQVTPFTFSKCSIQKGQQNYALAMSQNPQFGIFVIDLSNGDLVKAFYEFSSTSLSIKNSRYAIGIIMTQSNIIYVFSGESDKVMVSALQFDQTKNQISPVYYRTYGTSTNKFYGYDISLTAALDYVYIAGSVKQLLAMTKISLSTGTSAYTYMIDNISGNSALKALTKIEIYEYLLQIFQITCAENLGPDGNDVALLDFSETLGGVITLAKTWFLDMSSKTRCLSVNFNSITVWFLIYVEQNSAIYYGKTDTLFAGTTLTLNQIKVSSSLTQTLIAKDGYISEDGSKAIWLGQVSAINQDTYNKKSGFLMNYPQNSCLSSALTTNMQQSVKTQSLFILQFGSVAFSNPSQAVYSSMSDSIVYKQIDSIQSQSLKDIDIIKLPDECQALMTPGSIIKPILNSLQYSYQILELNPQTLNIDIPDFKYSIDCDDLVWAYYSTLSNQQTLPTFIEFKQIESGGSRITISTNDNTTAGIYSIKIRGVLNNIYEENILITLTMLGIPSTMIDIPPVEIAQNETNNVTENQIENNNSVNSNTSIQNNQTNSSDINDQENSTQNSNISESNLNNTQTEQIQNQTQLENNQTNNLNSTNSSTNDNQTLANQTTNETFNSNSTENSTNILNDTTETSNETNPANQTDNLENTTNITENNQTNISNPTNESNPENQTIIFENNNTNISSGDQNNTNQSALSSNSSSNNSSINDTQSNQVNSNVTQVNSTNNQNDNQTNQNQTDPSNDAIQNITPDSNITQNSSTILNNTIESLDNQTHPNNTNLDNSTSNFNQTGNNDTQQSQNNSRDNHTSSQNETIEQQNSTQNQNDTIVQLEPNENQTNSDQYQNSSNTENKNTTQQNVTQNLTENNQNSTSLNENATNVNSNQSRTNQSNTTYMKQKNAPYFNDDLAKEIIIYVKEIQSYKLPQIVNPDINNNAVELSYNIQPNISLPTFVKIQSRGFQLDPKSGDQGTYNLVIILSNRNSEPLLQSQYLLKIIVKPLDNKRDIQKFLQSLNQTKNEAKSNNTSIQMIDSDFKIQIDSISQRQRLKLSFSQPLLVQLTDDQINDLLILQANDGQGISKLKGWNIVSTNLNGILIQLNFYNNYEVSSNQDPDYISISLNNTKSVISSKSLLYMDKTLKISMKIPTQFDNDGKNISSINTFQNK
ncbi:UNKNOWN [Stylonychia lemnae]|uniref:Uncharacterized protein n=1 Tax=Stylonychia lemnae TaxID=5949 RepID=A0A077ZQI2_STYLE|nr:UNKNOWN [Stylonychia lemnae]|eukprot:CDW72173.1 UNKNOWN [Stylonychia lemnae]